MRMAEILHRLGYVRKGHLVSVTRDDLVGQYIGHTAPKTKEVLKRAMGGVLFIDEAYYLYRPENERDYGQEAIEILLQVMENNRDDLVVILAGYRDRMDTFFRSNPGMASRIAHHIDFPDYSDAELYEIATLMLAQLDYRLDAGAETALREYIAKRRMQPNFANARSMRNALDRARLRQANRLFALASTGDARRVADDRGGRHPGEPRISRRLTMLHGRTTLSKFIIEEQRRLEGGAELIALVNDIQTACKYIASAVARGALTSMPSRSALGDHSPLGRPGGLMGDARGSAGSVNVQGEDQKPLDLIANDIMLGELRLGRLPRRHGVRGDGRAVRHSAAVSARTLPARVRPARRLVEPRRQRDRRHDLLGAARARRGHRPRAGGLPAARARSRSAPATRCTGPRR